MRLADARIGWSSYSADFSHPGDRRRFAAYAALRGLAYERASLEKRYDLVLATHSSDLPGWTQRKRVEGGKLKLVLELIDSYFVQQGVMRRYAKGMARFALGTESRLSPDFLKTLVRACEAADAVICSTLEQQETIRRYNPNVFMSFDHFAAELEAPKSDYSRADKLRIVWEGQATTVPNLQVIREPLNDLRDKVELHVVTDRLNYRHFGRFRPYPSMDALTGIECPKFFHEWQKDTFSRHVVAADVAVIPIDETNLLWRGKPENKLVLLWQLGMPVLATATPVYARVMAASGLAMACRNTAEWGGALQRMLDAPPAALQGIGTRARSYASDAYSTEAFAFRFDAAFRSIGFAV